MAVPDDKPRTHLLRGLYFNSSGVLFLMMLLAAVLMLIVSQQVHGAANQVWLAIGTSLLATTGYSFLQVLLTTRQFNNFLSGTIKTTVQETIEDQRKRFYPVTQYPEVREPGPEFNRDLNNSLISSSHYTFCGMTANYAVARLACLRKVPGDVTLIIADPTKPEAVDHRALRRAKPGDEHAFKRERKRILDDIYLSLVGAYLGRRAHRTLQICMTIVPGVNRAEICDNDIYVSVFSEARHSELEFPPVLRFSRESVIYGMQSQDCAGLLASRYLKKFTLIPEMSEADFLAQLRAAEVEMTAEQWDDLKQRFPAFRDEQRNRLIPP